MSVPLIPAFDHLDRIWRIIERQKQLFRDAATENPIVRGNFDLVRAEGLGEEYAWLFAANALIEQNRRLFASAVVNFQELEK